MFSRLKLKTIRIQHLGPENDSLSELSVFGFGGYQLSQLAQKLRLKRAARPTGVHLQINADQFSLSVPSEYKVTTEDSLPIWSGVNSGPSRASFSWNVFPLEVSIELPNRNKFRFCQKVVTALSVESPLRLSVPIVGAVLVHMISVVFISLPSSIPERKPMKVSVDLIQPTNFKRTATNETNSSDNSTVARMSATRQLLRSLNVGKKKHLLAKSTVQHSNAFSDKGENSRRTWSIDQDILEPDETPINLTDAQIKTALQPAYAKLKECYEDALIHDSSLRGQPQLKIDIEQSGKISAVNLSYLNARADSLQQLKECFFRAYRNIRVPNPNRDFQVVHTLILNY